MTRNSWLLAILIIATLTNVCKASAAGRNSSIIEDDDDKAKSNNNNERGMARNRNDTNEDQGAEQDNNGDGQDDRDNNRDKGRKGRKDDVGREMSRKGGLDADEEKDMDSKGRNDDGDNDNNDRKQRKRNQEQKDKDTNEDNDSRESNDDENDGGNSEEGKSKKGPNGKKNLNKTESESSNSMEDELTNIMKEICQAIVSVQSETDKCIKELKTYDEKYHIKKHPMFPVIGLNIGKINPKQFIEVLNLLESNNWPPDITKQFLQQLATITNEDNKLATIKDVLKYAAVEWWRPFFNEAFSKTFKTFDVLTKIIGNPSYKVQMGAYFDWWKVKLIGLNFGCHFNSIEAIYEFNYNRLRDKLSTSDLYSIFDLVCNQTNGWNYSQSGNSLADLLRSDEMHIVPKQAVKVILEYGAESFKDISRRKQSNGWNTREMVITALMCNDDYQCMHNVLTAVKFCPKMALKPNQFRSLIRSVANNNKYDLSELLGFIETVSKYYEIADETDEAINNFFIQAFSYSNQTSETEPVMYWIMSEAKKRSWGLEEIHKFIEGLKKNDISKDHVFNFLQTVKEKDITKVLEIMSISNQLDGEEIWGSKGNDPSKMVKVLKAGIPGSGEKLLNQYFKSKTYKFCNMEVLQAILDYNKEADAQMDENDFKQALDHVCEINGKFQFSETVEYMVNTFQLAANSKTRLSEVLQSIRNRKNKY